MDHMVPLLAHRRSTILRAYWRTHRDHVPSFPPRPAGDAAIVRGPRSIASTLQQAFSARRPRQRASGKPALRPHAPPQLCDAPAGGGRLAPDHSAVSRPQRAEYHGDLHARDPRAAGHRARSDQWAPPRPRPHAGGAAGCAGGHQPVAAPRRADQGRRHGHAGGRGPSRGAGVRPPPRRGRARVPPPRAHRHCGVSNGRDGRHGYRAATPAAWSPTTTTRAAIGTVPRARRTERRGG